MPPFLSSQPWWTTTSAQWRFTTGLSRAVAASPSPKLGRRFTAPGVRRSSAAPSRSRGAASRARGGGGAASPSSVATRRTRRPCVERGLGAPPARARARFQKKANAASSSAGSSTAKKLRRRRAAPSHSSASPFARAPSAVPARQRRALQAVTSA